MIISTIHSIAHAANEIVVCKPSFKTFSFWQVKETRANTMVGSPKMLQVMDKSSTSHNGLESTESTSDRSSSYASVHHFSKVSRSLAPLIQDDYKPEPLGEVATYFCHFIAQPSKPFGALASAGNDQFSITSNPNDLYKP